MLVVLLCCMMKLVEISAIASSPYHSGGKKGGENDPPPPVLNNTLGSLPQPSAYGKCKREDVVSVKRKRRRRFKRINGLIIDGGGRRSFAKNNLTTASGQQQQQLNPMTVGDMAVPIIGVGGVIVTTKGSPHSPTDSDCNSNPHQNNASCLSNTSSQDIEFIQDNNDYQWFLDYGYRDNNHTSILSLAESYEAQDLGYYDTLAKNMDANLAEADIESFRTEDIHALLTNLPPMCTDQLSQENNRQGESYASISNSLLGLHFTNSHHSTSHQSNASSSSQSNQLDYSANNDSMSICKSELLFSPVKEVPEGGSLLLPPGGVNFSVDSLDCDDLMLTCQNTNMENYTIAFEGSGGMGYGEEEGEEIEWAGEVERNNSDRLLRHYSSSLQKSHVARLLKKHNNCGKISLGSMTQSDSGNLTTWSKLKKLNRIEGKMERHPSGNNNQATVDDSATQATLQFGANMTGQTVKSQSMPNLCRRKTSSSNQLPQGRIVAPSMLSHMYLVNRSQLNSSDSSTECPTLKRKPVKVFNIQHQSTTSGSGGSVLSEMATSVDGGSTSSAHSKSHAQNFSLVKLFMKQKSISAEGMSTGLDDQSSISENWNLSNSCNENKQTISNFDDSLLQTNKYNNDTSAIVHNKQQFLEKDNKNTKLNQIDLTLNLNKSSSNNNNNSSLELSDYNAAKRTHQKIKSRMTNAKRSNKNVAAANQTASSDSSCFAKPPPPLHKHVPIHLMNKSIQTSTLDNLANITNKPAPYKLNGGCPRTTHHQQGRCERFKVVEPSFLSKLKREGEVEQTEKPVYVLYPNYVLPNLDFLHEKNDSTKVILLPQQTKPLTSPRSSDTANSPSNRRPFSCNDLEAILKSGGGRNQFAHVRDWDSLLPLLPHDYQRVLAGVPEVRGDGRKQPMGVERTASLDRGGSYCCNSSSSGCRGSSTILSSDISTPSCATKFNPLFVYRYDSATSSETSQTTHAHANVPPALPKRLNLINGGGKYDAVPPPRPPLPRGILRRGNAADVKMRPRYSMFEMTEEEFYSEIANKRRSLQEPYQGVIRNKRLSETEDEGVDAGTSSSSLDSNDHQFQHSQNPPKTHNPNYNNPHNNPTHVASHNQPQNMSNPHNNVLFANLSHEDLRQLEDFLQQSNSSLDNNNGSRNGNDHGSREVLGDDLGMLELRSQVSRFLALRINSQCQEAAAAICGGAGRKVSFMGEPEGRGPNNSPLNVSCTTAQRSPNAKSPGTLLVDMPDIHEEATPSTNSSNPSSYHSSPRHHTKRPPQSQLSSNANPQQPVLRSTSNKQHQLIAAVTEAVEGIIRGFSPATNQPELDALGDSARNPSGARVTLTRLCPALYAVLSDGLKGVLETSFGPIGNSVWQVVEASAQQGPLTKALNDLVMKINSEDVITEGLVKFNAFVFGLLNVRSLDAWLSYLRTRESVLRKHYEPEALLVQALMGGTEVRQLLDGLIATVQPLALLPFQYDLLFEYRLLHESLKKMDTYQQQLSPTHQQFKSWKTDNAAAPTDNVALPDLLNNSTSTTPPHLTVKASNSQINHAPKVRPRSYVDYFRQPATARGQHQSADYDDIAHEHCHQPRRWSGISANHKLFQAYSKLEVDEEYTDSLEEFNGGGDGGAIPCILTSATTCLANGSNNQPESLESNMSLNDEKPLNGRKFKKLQRRWEMLSGTNTSPPDTPSLQQHQHYQKDTISPPNLISNNQTNTNPYSLPNSSPSGNGGSAATASAAARLSKIPRPVTSPVKPAPCSGNSGIPVPVSPPGGGAAHVGKSGGRKVVTPPGGGGGVGVKKVGGAVGVSPVKKPVAAPRTSRLDQLEQNAQETRTLTRPSSLPYKPHNAASKGSKVTPPRRAISTSVNRKGVSGAGSVIQTKLPNTLIELPEINEIRNKSQTKVVRTLSHRLPSESGHLPYNEGERLKVVLEVDGQWLLCCRGTQKGLVPRTAVIACDTLIPGSRF